MQVNDAGLASLGAFREIHQLDLSRTKVTDAGMRELASVNGVMWLNLRGNHINDEGVTELANIQSVVSLGLAETRVSDAGVSALTKLAFLQMLDLSGTRVTDTGLKNLGGMKFLMNLTLARTAITDRGIEGIEQIRQIPMPRSIDLRGTKATRAGIEKLQEQAPNAAIQWDGDPGVSSIEYSRLIGEQHYDARRLELGGTLALPKMPIPGVGWLAYLKDTEANVFGLMQSDPSAK